MPKPRLRLTDTTFRDANQSLLGGRLRPREILPLAKKLDGIGFFALEAFGGATFETSLRLGDDPWHYLRELAKVTPNTPIQALIRGQNLVGHRNYADDAVELFVKTAANLGVEVFRVFDPLNDLRNMEVAIRSARRAGARVQGALSYAISPVHDHDFWCSLAKGLAAFEVQDLVIKDTSGLLTPQVAWELVTALKEMTGLPVVVHSHCSSGMAPMSYMAAIEAGAAVVDTALSPLAWGASQPATESVVAALAGGDYDTGLDLEKLIEVKLDLEQAKREHVGDFSPWVDRVDADILRYQMPGFMLEDINRQLDEHSALERTHEVMAEVPRVREELGYPPLVAPIRQLIASQAVYNILGGERYATVTQELKDYLQGLYGRPPRPAEAEIRRLVLGREEPITVRPADLLEPQVESARSQLKKRKLPGGDDHVLTYLLFPQLALELAAKPKEKPSEQKSGEEAEAVAAEGDQAEAAAQGAREEAAAEAPATQAAAQAQTAEFDVEVDGENFKVRVTGAGLAVLPAGGSAAGPSGGSAPVAPPTAPAKDAIAAPMQGLIVKLPVKQGDEVKIGEVVAVLEAMKMQNDIVASKPGRVTDIYVSEGQVVTPNQPLVAIG
ncbi:pyruvate carboxylase subunit B [Candidatus Dormiibacter inghamiae]|uniref:pyruvate carboxylase subunit B n=1 Tax=Candidatus Dormiibacter inghamiae TaxID=3127013 RepID=UPI001A3089A7|nr:pyruvate carboxylase subunit B [Candidatus Dormibacteraeota bacterium]